MEEPRRRETVVHSHFYVMAFEIDCIYILTGEPLCGDTVDVEDKTGTIIQQDWGMDTEEN